MVRLSLRLPETLHARLVEQASADRRSLNSEILHLLENALGPAEGVAGPPGRRPASPGALGGRPESSSA
ncbi:Arc family DNA-binding protein [Actinomadura montaniterrae]|uniref:Arc family DNA-binding protein n=1 Tax=Actinomadura montaniterrae TaxID=1803903 RepID=A0A6L3W1G9_9ACTN|nr:Arc family DNA-binding protein [Actinomadura montaniterrae]